MPPVNITSTTDTEEMVNAAMSEVSPEDALVEKEESAQDGQTAKSGETQKNSEASDEDSEVDEAEDSEESEDEEAEQLEAKKKKPRSGYKKRIDKLTRRLSERDREIEYWKGRAEGQKPADSQSKPNPQAAEAKAKPSADDFETHEEYVEALADWKVDQRLQKLEVKERETEARTVHQQKVETLQSRVKEFAKAHSDFEEVIEDVGDIPMSPAVQELILDSDNGPELMYELAKDPDEYARICKLSPLAAARAMGQFESKIKARASEEKVVKKTNTPAPIKPVTSKNATSTKKSIFDESLSQREYERMMEERAERRASSW
jgi:hypothetical protein